MTVLDFCEAFRLRRGRLFVCAGMRTGMPRPVVMCPTLRCLLIDIHCCNLYIASTRMDRI